MRLFNLRFIVSALFVFAVFISFNGCTKEETKTSTEEKKLESGQTKKLTTEFTGNISEMNALNVKTILGMSLQQMQDLAWFESSKDSPVNVRFKVKKISLSTIPGYDPANPIYAFGGEGNSMPNVSGNGWGNGMTADQLEKWKLKDGGDYMYFDMPELIQFNLVQCQFKGKYVDKESVRYFNIETFVTPDGQMPSWAYINHTSDKHRVAFDNPLFPIKG